MLRHRYFHKQLEVWLNTLDHVMPRMLQVYTYNITAAQAVKIFTAKKYPKRSSQEHFLYLLDVNEAAGEHGTESMVLDKILQCASSEHKMILLTKHNITRTVHLRQAKKLAHVLSQSRWTLQASVLSKQML